MIETRVDGVPAQVRRAAAWLDRLADGVGCAADLVAGSRSTAGAEWAGEAGEAYGRLAGGTVLLTDQRARRVRRAAASFDSYADHLEGVQQRAAAIRDRAHAGGLVVDGTVVLRPPTAVAPDPPPVTATPTELRASAAATAAHREAEARTALYDRLAGEMTALRTEHVEWVDTRLRSDAADDDGERGWLDAVGRLAGLWPGAGTTSAFTLSALMAWPGLAVKERVAWLEAHAAASRDSAAGLARDGRSGHPGRRAAATTPDAAEQRRLLGRAGDAAADDIGRLGKMSKALGPASLVVEGFMDYRDIKNGESPTETLVGTGAAVGAAAAVCLIGAPALPVALAAGAAAVAAEAGSDWLLRQVPDEVLDEVDDALADAWDAGADAVGGVVDGVGDVASDAWDGLKEVVS